MADSSVCALVNSVHDGAWFRLPDDEKFVVCGSGGRQGCKLGALIFSLIYSLALKQTREALKPLNVVLRVSQSRGAAFWSCDDDPMGEQTASNQTPDTDVFEVTYVDDGAAFLAATSARALLTRSLSL